MSPAGKRRAASTADRGSALPATASRGRVIPQIDGFGTFRQPVGVVRREVHHQADHRNRLVSEPADAEPAYFDQSCQRGRRLDQQPSMARFEMDAIVSNQARERQQSRLRGVDERERQFRFARAGASADQHGAGAGQYRRGVDGRSVGSHHGAGRRTMKRAPRTVGGSSGLAAGLVRFSTQMRPPWASIMCLEMERPRPEFCPKSCSGR